MRLHVYGHGRRSYFIFNAIPHVFWGFSWDGMDGHVLLCQLAVAFLAIDWIEMFTCFSDAGESTNVRVYLTRNCTDSTQIGPRVHWVISRT